MSPAGYSGTPLVGKLGIKAAHTLSLGDAQDGFVDKVCAVVPTWSGLRLVLRRELRPGRQRAAG